MDHFTSECLGVRAAQYGSQDEAPEPISLGVQTCVWRVCRGCGASLFLWHNHSSQFVSHDFRAEVTFLGIEESSSNFVRSSEGNGVHCFFRTLKEQLL